VKQELQKLFHNGKNDDSESHDGLRQMKTPNNQPHIYDDKSDTLNNPSMITPMNYPDHDMDFSNLFSRLDVHDSKS